MKGNLIFGAIILLFLFTLALVSSRAFLPATLKQPANVTVQP